MIYTTQLSKPWRTCLPRDARRGRAGRRVSYMVLNAKHLFAKRNDGTKVRELGELLQKCRWPDLVMVTELSGASGHFDVRKKLGACPGILREYKVVYSQRSVDLAGGPPNTRCQVGGGVALFVHKRLGVVVSQMPTAVSEEDKPFLDGHLRVWRLDPQPAAVRRSVSLRVPLIVTAAYIPPVDASGWGHRTRRMLFDAIERSDEAIRDLRRVQDVCPITMAHINAPWGGCELEMRAECAQLDVEAKRRALAAVPIRWRRKRRGSIDMTADGRVLLRPCYSVRQSEDTTPDGVAFMEAAARNGMLPVAGVTGHLQSTSWTTCRGCSNCAADSTACQHMRGMHDVVMVPDELVWRALTCCHGGKSLLWQCVRRRKWSDVIDHAVTEGHIWVDRGLESAQPGVVAPASSPQRTGPRRYRPPSELWQKSNALRGLADGIRKNLFKLLPVCDDECGDVDIDAVDATLVEAMILATDSTRAKQKQGQKGDTAAVKAARILVAKCRTEVAAAVKARPRWPKDRMPSHKRRVEVAHAAVRAAQVKLDGLQQWQHASVLAWSQARAPKEFWRLMDESSRDPGEPDQAAACLLQHQTDSAGKRVSSDPAVLRRNMGEECASVHRLAPEVALGQRCSAAIDDALVVLHFESSATVAASLEAQVTLPARSSVALSAADPLAPMAKVDALRGVRRDLRDAMNRYAVDRAKEDSRAQVAQRRFRPHIQRLNRVPTMDELQGVFAKLTDVGPGVDGVSPVILRFVEAGLCLETMLRLFQRVLATGVQPRAWRVHRMLFHYKGKNEDPYCLANYRVLGIDHLLLKIWSLLLVERLDEYIRITKGLSVLQGGFQRQRGCPEQAFTLSETVRLAAKTGSVHLTFIDINKAYDRVIHPILWKKCIDRGITGLFLASLQAIYHEAEAVVDLGGVLLDPVDLQTGVLQGNPLSPLLFNIYIDDAIRELERRGRARARPYGLWLPLRDRSGRVVSDSRLDQSNFTPCLFFADDGVLMEHDVKTLQEMLNIVNEELRGDGLTLNVGKTKWMLVPRPDVQLDEYKAMKEAFGKSPLMVGPNAISLVDEFMYLGFRMWWRWNWVKAWQSACMRAWRAFHVASQGGWQHRAGSLDSQLTYAKNKILCHFTYVAAVAGAGGAPSSAPWKKCDDVVDAVLRAISGYHKANMTALRIEAGIWDQRTRIDMLLLRMFCKFASSSVDAPFFRAMYLSLDMVPRGVDGRAQSDKYQAINKLQYQPWGQQLCAAAERLGVPLALPPALPVVRAPGPHRPAVPADLSVAHCVVDRSKIRPAAYRPQPIVDALVGAGGAVFRGLSARGVVLLQADCVGDGSFTGVGHGDVVPARVPLRLVLPGVVPRYVPDVNCWPLVLGTNADDVFLCWSLQLKTACYAALKRRGNVYRQTLVRAFLDEQVAEQSRLRRWASTLSASFQQPYWRLADVAAARRLLRLRLDLLPNEEQMRWCPHTLAKLRLPRIPVAAERACYLCPGIDGAVDVFWPETLEHVLLTCVCPRLVALRASARVELRVIAASPEAMDIAHNAGVAVPRFDDDTELLTTLRLCIGIGPVAALQAVPVVLAAPEVRRAGPQFQYNADAARRTAAWIGALTGDWCDIHRNARRGGLSDAPGGCLALFVARHAVRVFCARRIALESVVGFQQRVRDPPNLLFATHQAPVASSEPVAPVGIG